MTLSAAMKRLHQSDLKAGGQGFFDRVSRRPAVPHGLRSTFRDWVAERTQFAGDMAEVALAHRVSNAVEAAYRRGDMVEKRRVMMDAWAAFLSDKAQEKKSSEVELTNCKALEAWRLAEELSVCDATVLICGGDPSTAFSRNPDWELEPWEDVEFEGFDGVFKALIAAIRGNKIPARLAFKAYDGPQRPDANFSVVFLKRDRIENNLDNDPFFMLADGDTWEAEWADKLVIEKDPLWDKSMVDVEDLKRWLSSRGHTNNFFFANDADPASLANVFLDRNHPHFSPELALAVYAWQALKGEQELQRSPKQAISDWIDSNPEAWEGDTPLSNKAKERVITMLNWKKEGGANRTP